MSNLATTIESSNMPSRHKSALRKWFDDAKGGMSLSRVGSRHISAAGSGIRQGGEAIMVGGALGLAHAQLPTGLDVKIGKAKLPMDGVAGVLGMVAGIGMAHEEYGTDLRNAASSCLSVFTFRQGYRFLAQYKTKNGGKPGGTFAGEDDDAGDDNMGEEDPIVREARNLHSGY